MNEDFTHRHLAAIDKKVHRLGLSASFGLSPDGIREAFDHGMNYVFYVPTARKLTAPLRERLAKDRESVVVAAGPSFAYVGGNVRRAAERLLKKLDTDYIDVFHLFWLGVGSAWTDGTVGELQKLKEEGKVRAIGVSIHDRPRAGKLAEDSPLDLLMIRYNAAHPGAEKDIFPHLDKRRPTIVSYTATRWRKLLKRPSGWDDRAATAGECYRFCLSSPHVDVTLCGPKSVEQLRENLAAIEQGPLSDEEMAWMRRFGKAVHG